MYMESYPGLLRLAYFTYHNVFLVHPHCSMSLNNTPLCVNITFCLLVLFIHQCTLGLLCPFDSCEQCCYEHGCTNMFESLLSILLAIYPEKLLDHWYSIFKFLRILLPYRFPQQLNHFKFSPAMFNFSTTSSTLIF